MSEKHAELVIWNELLQKVIVAYLNGMGGFKAFFFDTGLSSYSRDILHRVRETDILITEASRPGTHKNAEGFRLAVKLMDICLNLKPMVIFRTLDNKFLEYPCFADYSTIHLLPEKINSILKSERFDRSAFDSIIEKYPYLKSRPVHKKVV